MAERGAALGMTRDRVPAAAAVVVAIAVALVGVVKGTWAVGGSDSSCYALMADAFASGDWQPKSSIATAAPWPDAARTLAPAGFLPSPHHADAASPICAPGFALVLAPFRWLGGPDGIFIVTPLAGALLIWWTFVVGRQLAGPIAGLAAAAASATIPVLLFQVVQPMNDVLVAALWMAVLAAASLPEPTRAWCLGLATGMAVLVRPNLAPSAIVVAVWLAVVTLRRHGWSGMLARTALAFLIASAPFVLLVLLLNAVLYGHPFQSGYGQVADLFALGNVSTNLRQYGTAIRETQWGFPLLGLVALVVAPARARGLISLGMLVSAAIATVYLLYRPFPEWWYLRFLLPALVPMTVLATASITWMTELIRPRHLWAGSAVALGVGIVLSLLQLRIAGERQAFDLQRLERRFRTAGHVVRDRLPAHAALVSVWESGTVRYHARREAVLWDSIEPGSLDAVIRWLQGQGFEPFLVIEQWEEPLFRARFAGRSTVGDLDWPPRFDVERQVRIYSPADRDVFRQGGRVATEFVLHR